MQVSLLGPVEVSVDGRRVPIGAGKPRALLTLLALHEGSAVSTDRLVEGLWGEEPPASATKMVQLLVSQLRKALAAAGDGASIVTRGRGYELHLGAEGARRAAVRAADHCGYAARGTRAVARRTTPGRRRGAVRDRRDPAARGASPEGDRAGRGAGTWRRAGTARWSGSSSCWSRRSRWQSGSTHSGCWPFTAAAGRRTRSTHRAGAPARSTRSGSSRDQSSGDLQEAILRQDPALDLHLAEALRAAA